MIGGAEVSGEKAEKEIRGGNEDVGRALNGTSNHISCPVQKASELHSPRIIFLRRLGAAKEQGVAETRVHAAAARAAPGPTLAWRQQ